MRWRRFPALNREISMYISRSGEVLDITIGGINSVDLKDMHLRRNKAPEHGALHPPHPGGNPQLSDVDISSLRAMRFDAMAAVGARTAIQPAYSRLSSVHTSAASIRFT